MESSAKKTIPSFQKRIDTTANNTQTKAVASVSGAGAAGAAPSTQHSSRISPEQKRQIDMAVATASAEKIMEVYCDIAPFKKEYRAAVTKSIFALIDESRDKNLNLATQYPQIALRAFEILFAQFIISKQTAAQLICAQAICNMLQTTTDFDGFETYKREYHTHLLYYNNLLQADKKYLNAKVLAKYVATDFVANEIYMRSFCTNGPVPSVTEMTIEQLQLERKNISEIEKSLEEFSGSIALEEQSNVRKTSAELVENELELLSIYHQIVDLGDYSGNEFAKVFDYIKEQIAKTYPNAIFNKKSAQKSTPEDIYNKIKDLAKKNHKQSDQTSHSLTAINAVRKFYQGKDRDEKPAKTKPLLEVLSNGYSRREAGEIAFEFYSDYEKYSSLTKAPKQEDTAFNLLDLKLDAQTFYPNPAYYLAIAANNGHKEAQFLLAKFLDPNSPEKLGGLAKEKDLADLFYALARDNGLDEILQEQVAEVVAIDPLDNSKENTQKLQALQHCKEARKKHLLLNEFSRQQAPAEASAKRALLNLYDGYDSILKFDADIFFRKILLLINICEAEKDQKAIDKYLREISFNLDLFEDLQLQWSEVHEHYKKIPQIYIENINRFIEDYPNKLEIKILELLAPEVAQANVALIKKDLKKKKSDDKTLNRINSCLRNLQRFGAEKFANIIMMAEEKVAAQQDFKPAPAAKAGAAATEGEAAQAQMLEKTLLAEISRLQNLPWTNAGELIAALKAFGKKFAPNALEEKLISNHCDLLSIYQDLVKFDFSQSKYATLFLDLKQSIEASYPRITQSSSASGQEISNQEADTLNGKIVALAKKNHEGEYKDCRLIESIAALCKNNMKGFGDKTITREMLQQSYSFVESARIAKEKGLSVIFEPRADLQSSVATAKKEGPKATSATTAAGAPKNPFQGPVEILKTRAAEVSKILKEYYPLELSISRDDSLKIVADGVLSRLTNSKIALRILEADLEAHLGNESNALALTSLRAINALIKKDKTFDDSSFKNEKQYFETFQLYLESCLVGNLLNSNNNSAILDENRKTVQNTNLKKAPGNKRIIPIHLRIREIKLGNKTIEEIQKDFWQFKKVKAAEDHSDFIDNHTDALEIYQKILTLGYKPTSPYAKLFDYIKQQFGKHYPNAKIAQLQSSSAKEDDVYKEIVVFAKQNYKGGRLEGTRLLVIPNAVRKFGKDSDREIFDPKELLSSSLDPEEAAEIALELYKSTKKAEYLRIAANYPNGEAQLLLAQFLDPEKTDAVIDGVEKNQVEAELFYSLAKENNVQETIAPQSAVASAEPENGIRPLDGATKKAHTPALSEVLALTQEQLQQMQLRAQLFTQKPKPKQPEFQKRDYKLSDLEEQDERQNAREFVDERLYLDDVNLSADEIYLLEDTLEEAVKIQKTRPEHQDWINDLIYDLRYLKLRHELKFPKKDCSVEELIKWSQEIWFKNKNLVDYENIIFDKVRDKIDELKKLLYREDLQTKDPETLSKLKLLEEILMHVISRNAMLQENHEAGGWKKHILSIAENENGHPEERSAAYLTLAIELLRDDPLHSSYDEDKVKKDAQYYRYLFQSAQLGCENAKETIHEICNNFMDSKTFSTEHIDFVFGAARLNIAAAQLLAVRLYLNNKIGDSLAGEVFEFVDDINKNRAFFDEHFPGQIPMFKFVKDIESVDELKNIERNINNVDRLGIMQASQLQFEQREQQLQREIAELKRQLQQAQQGPEVKPDELPETPKESEPEKVLPTQPPQQTVGVKPDGARVEQVPSELASSPRPSYSQALQARSEQQKNNNKK